MKKYTSFIGIFFLALLVALPSFKNVTFAEPLPVQYNYGTAPTDNTTTQADALSEYDSGDPAGEDQSSGPAGTITPPIRPRTTPNVIIPPPGTVGSGAVNASNTSATLGTTGVPQASSSSLRQCDTQFKSLLDILIWLKCIIIVAIVPMIFVLAFLFFLWGVLRFIQASDSTKKEEGKKFILWGIVGLFVMTSVWGIIKIVGNTLGTGDVAVPFLQTEYLKKK